MTWVSLFVVAQSMLLVVLCGRPLTNAKETCPNDNFPDTAAVLMQREMQRERNKNRLHDALDQAKVPAQLGDAYQNDWTLVDHDMQPVVIGRSVFQNKSLTGTAPTSESDPLNGETEVSSYCCWPVFGGCIGLTEWLHNASGKLPAHMVAAKLGLLEIQQNVANTVRLETVKVSEKVKALVRRIAHGQTMNEYPSSGFLPEMHGKGDFITGSAAVVLMTIGLVLILLWCLNVSARRPPGH